MKLLLDERKLILGIGNNIEYGVWGNVCGMSSWRINPTAYMMDGNYHLEDIGDKEIPTYVKAHQYYYIDGEFKLADTCPNEYKDRIIELENEVAITELTMIENYEAQEEINAQTENALIEIYEMMEV